MSDNYRSRTERNHVKNQEKKHIKKKNQRKRLLFKKFLIGCLLLGIVGLVAGVSAFFVMVKDAPKLDKSKLVNPLSTKFLDKTEISFMNTVLKNEHMLLMIKFKSS